MGVVARTSCRADSGSSVTANLLVTSCQPEASQFMALPTMERKYRWVRQGAACSSIPACYEEGPSSPLKTAAREPPDVAHGARLRLVWRKWEQASGGLNTSLNQPC